MAKDYIVDKLTNIVEDYVELDGKLDENLSLSGDMGLDSFGLIQMVGSIEDNFNINIPEYEFSNFVTVSDIVGYIQKNA